MHTRVEKSKGIRSEVSANSAVRKKDNDKQASGFVDKRRDVHKYKTIIQGAASYSTVAQLAEIPIQSIYFNDKFKNDHMAANLRQAMINSLQRQDNVNNYGGSTYCVLSKGDKDNIKENHRVAYNANNNNGNAWTSGINGAHTITTAREMTPDGEYRAYETTTFNGADIKTGMATRKSDLGEIGHLDKAVGGMAIMTYYSDSIDGHVSRELSRD
ncbi:hypothetical protein [Desulfoluna spongiiphila]|uniref:Uncharacterized protein n=1 Tax=Desulfoluna spongiiphila TaxID=419481 RepID=A0A1G5DJK2_9BACT|nr:hypothetical protein [Desulfoluna spongiiphila]SCY14744.1 hypothetical protein SAMN05216233_104222 [Desulfoluna spongiiphila]